MTPAKAHDPLAEQIAQYYDDPLGYVLDVFPWGKGELEHSAGPDKWQTAALEAIGKEVRARRFDGRSPVTPVRFCRASGHDIGKTTMAAWIVCWIKDTRPDSQGTVTANTFAQLQTKTWAAIQKWTKLAATRDWWEIMGSMMYHREPGRRETWFVACQSSSDENSEAFAGQHAKTSTSYYIFDEASAIPDVIWEVAEGGLTDGEPHIYAFGNPTRNHGAFYEACFGNKRHRWNHGSIDSRDSGISNKDTIQQWLEDYGEDSDFFRVRVRGLPPNQSEDQLIGKETVSGAQKRRIAVLDDEPLVAGFDVSGGGSAWNVIRFRRGLDARPGAVPAPVRIAGSRSDRASLVAQCAAILRDERPSHKVSMMFVDSAFGAPIVERLHTLGFDNVCEVNFGGKSPDQHFANMRAYMWAKGMKEWLERGAIDPNDTKLEIDLTGPGFHFDKQNRLVVESKEDMQKRGVPSPDDADALALTFAARIAPQINQRPEEPAWSGKYGSHGWLR